MLRRAQKPQEPERKGFAFNPSLKLFRKRIYFGLSLEWEDTSQE